MQIYNGNKTDTIIAAEDIRPTLVKSSLAKIGFVLKESREKKGLSVKDIKDLTHIPEHHIVAIENGLRDKLPEDLFLTGFIRRYARALNLNDELLINKYFDTDPIIVKTPNASTVSDPFDTLFEKDNVIHLKTKSNFLRDEISKVGFLQVYHFYLVIGIILFLIAFTLMITNVNKKNQSDKYASDYVEGTLKGDELSLDADFAYDDEELFVEAESVSIQDSETVLEEPEITEVVEEPSAIVEDTVEAVKVIEDPKPEMKIGSTNKLPVQSKSVVQAAVAVKAIQSKPVVQAAAVVKTTQSKPAVKTQVVSKQEPKKVEIITFTKPTQVQKTIIQTQQVAPAIKIEKLEVVKEPKIEVVQEKAPEPIDVKPLKLTEASFKTTETRSRIPVDDNQVMLRGLR